MTEMLLRTARLIEWMTVRIGRWGSLLLPVLMIVIVLNVAVRYGLGLGLVELEEIQWHLNALVVLACLAYAYKADAHVRVDVLRGGFSPRRRAIVELLGIGLLLLPFAIGICWFAWGSFTYSLSIGERSPMPSGLPARHVVKFAMFAGFLLLGLQGIAAICRQIRILSGKPDKP